MTLLPHCNTWKNLFTANRFLSAVGWERWAW